MKIQIECVSCLLKRIVFESEQSTNDLKLRKKVKEKTKDLLELLYDPNECSVVIATQIHKLAYDLLNDPDPYKELKKRANIVAEDLLPIVKNLIDKSKDRLKTAMLCSIIGNMLDFGIVGASNNPELLGDMFDQYYKQGLGYDDSEELKKFISKSKNILLFTDNCGEFTFDKILSKEIKNFNPEAKLTLVVKGKPVLSDATMQDANEINFAEAVDEVLTTGCFAVGVDFKKLPDDLKKALDKCDLIIAKGMANYEAFSETEYRPIAYLMRVKCRPIANSSNLPLNSSSIKLYK